MNELPLAFLAELEALIESRREASTRESYTARLFAAGPRRIAQKVGEEGLEVALASVEGKREHIVAEVADLTYHLLVLLRSHDLGLADVAAELKRRSQ